MKNVRNGRWKIESVIINSSTVMNYEGFEYLEVSGRDVSLQPVGINFVVQATTDSGAILVSGDTTYFIDSEVNGEQLKMQMLRPDCKDVFEITAMLETAPVPV